METVRTVVKRDDVLLDSRDASLQYHLGAADPKGVAFYYYQVRNNLSHRGKAAWRDGEIIRKSLVELADIFDAVLSRRKANAGGKVHPARRTTTEVGSNDR